MNDNTLNELVTDGTITSYDLNNVSENGDIGKESKFRNTERLKLYFPNGNTLTIDTFCSGSAENTVFIISK